MCAVGGGEIIAWRQPAVLIPLYLCLPSPPLNWKQMRVPAADRPREEQFNYCDTDRQDGGRMEVTAGTGRAVFASPTCVV